MDDLHRKLDQLLARGSGGSCPMCGICTQHSSQQDATASQLSAQAKLLENLEKKVMDLRNALEDLAHGLEERSCDKVSVPLAALQRRKSLPVRTSVDEVYVQLDKLRDQKIIQHTFNAPCGKGHKEILIEDTEAPEMIATPPRISPPPLEMTMPKPKMSTPLPKMKAITPSQKIVPPNPVTKSTTKTTPKITQASVPFKATVSSPNTTTVQASVATGSTTLPTNQKIQALWTAPVTTTSPTLVTSMSDHLPRFNVTENAAPPSSVHSLQKASLGVPIILSQGKEMSLFKSPQSPGSETVDSVDSQPDSPITKSMPGRDESLSPKTIRPPETSLVSSMPNSPPESTATEDVAPSHKLRKLTNASAPVATPQNIDKPSTNAPTTTLATKLSTLSPPTLSAATSFLKHVYSCPDNLQSLQATGGKAEAGITPPPFGKHGNASTGITCTGPLKTGGIQIKISSAPERTTTGTKRAPKTCFKIIDDVPPQSAPFPHRCVSLKTSPPSDFSIHTREVLGGGRFGKVHKCTDNKSRLRLAAKIISSRNAKEREMVLNEIDVMNQLNHPNILQLFDAFETKNQIVLVLEYVEGGELFERIVDESCPLTEVDAMVFVKQICEGVQYMHQMYVLHLDLKPENILCVNRSSHQIKIIDFGLARRYKPREKLRVSFGTPEFLAPEVVNFDFVSFPTDMWTLGVVTYMLLSGLSPFLGDDDSETLNNVLTVNWYFDEETFEHVSAEAKDFISNLLIKERSGRLSAAQCLKHPWLNNISEKAKGNNIILKSQVLLRKYMARRLWKKNYIAIAAANRFKKIGSSGSLTTLGV
ncbi:hypothetical protein AMELA_G00193800 [Ameiurus melas]|uniref:Protein kinase domain-containing protein n=1 Tax=Ameiurus melas TaxID=219545 RepID=A0A7J6A537_AMEME|nr:hypothetical protein AMELA_G00193800 [Ameiurus melas]